VESVICKYGCLGRKHFEKSPFFQVGIMEVGILTRNIKKNHHFECWHLGSRHFGSHHFGSQHFESWHLDSQHFGSYHFESWHLESRHFGNSMCDCTKCFRGSRTNFFAPFWASRADLKTACETHLSVFKVICFEMSAQEPVNKILSEKCGKPTLSCKSINNKLFLVDEKNKLGGGN
jgi:hypothetical protein